MTMFATSTHSHAALKAPSLFRTFLTAIDARRQRAVLKSLDDSRLMDLGLTYADAAREAKRPVWDVPAHWRR